MSHSLINLSPDLSRLRDDGFEIEIRSGFLLVHNVPYVNGQREIRFGVLVSDVTLVGDVTDRPGTHVAHFIGTHPCGKDGVEIAKIKNQSQNKTLGPDLAIQHSFSAKPKGGYTDYHQKMQTYFAIISGPAYSIDPLLPRPAPLVIEATDDVSVFNYLDTASSRAGINVVTEKLRVGPVAIVGLGGTGSYVLDLLAKTPVEAIHLFDGDLYFQHNAFRTPGAPSVDDLREKPTKVEYFKRIYSNMHRRIHAHPVFIDDANVNELAKMSFVFICLDNGKARRLIFDKIEEAGISFIDVGMGVNLVDDELRGILRITTSTPESRDHVDGKVPFSGSGDNDYSTNIQIADLNALNATLAVIKWKKLVGFYGDLVGEHSSTYTIDGNILNNDDQNEAHESVHKFVEYIPDEVDESTIYVSIAFATAVHKCCCGCGEEIVTPLSPTDWKLTFDGETVSLYPSIGNWSLTCQSHYWIERNRIRWAAQWSREEIAAGRAFDAKAKERHFVSPENIEAPVAEREHSSPRASTPFWRKLRDWITGT